MVTGEAVPSVKEYQSTSAPPAGLSPIMPATLSGVVGASPPRLTAPSKVSAGSEGSTAAPETDSRSRPSSASSRSFVVDIDIGSDSSDQCQDVDIQERLPENALSQAQLVLPDMPTPSHPAWCWLNPAPKAMTLM